MKQALRLVAVAGTALVCLTWLAPTTEATSRALAVPLAVLSGASSITGEAGPTAVAASELPPVTVPDTTTTTSAPGRPLRLPQPAPLPEDPRADDPDEPIGRIVIPAIGLDSELGEGMTLTEIDRGPAHWPGTAMPGSLGNNVVAGHRTTWGAPFRHLHLLEAGDEIRFTVGSRLSVYRVTETFVVEPDDVWIADQGQGRVVTLFACHPVGSAAQRIVVRGELVPSSTEPTAL